MADVTMTTSTIQMELLQIMREMVVQLYTQGILKAENLGLQCVGFDHDLYNALVKRFNMNNPSLKRKGSHQLDSDRKVQRAKSSSTGDRF